MKKTSIKTKTKASKQTLKPLKQNKLIDALNRLDEFACDAAQGTTDAELQVYEDYTLLFDFLSKQK